MVSRDSTAHRALMWRPRRRARDGLMTLAVPSFDGRLTLTDRGDGVAKLAIAGRYRPPGGAADSLIDRLAMHRVARRTATIVVSAIAKRIEQVTQATVA